MNITNTSKHWLVAVANVYDVKYTQYRYNIRLLIADRYANVFPHTASILYTITVDDIEHNHMNSSGGVSDSKRMNSCIEPSGTVQFVAIR